MKKIIRYLNKRTRFFGFDIFKFFNAFRGIPFYYKDYKKIKKQIGKEKTFKLQRNFPILSERFEEGGQTSGHYFHQDLYVAKLIHKNCPIKHVDIGSRVDGFVAHLAVFREVEVFDIRNIENKIPNIIFRQQDMMIVSDDMANYCDSISALHSIEHFGLGRYGDPIDFNGHIKALKNISKIIEPNGKFYFSVPIGSQRIEFNAHRVFSISYVLELLKDDFKLDSFSYVDDNGYFNENITIEKTKLENNYGCEFGCGIFELTRT